MRILHILDHSIPLHSGYAFRTRAIIEQQRALGWETIHLTSPKHVLAGPPREQVNGWTFHRTTAPAGPLTRLPAIAEWLQMRATETRLDALAAETRPDVLHAHSPLLNAFPALRVGRRRGIPVVYEIRALWEDAAVSHGTCREGDPRYRLTHALETRAARRADAVTTICEGLRADLIGRGLAAEKITVIPNAVDTAAFAGARDADPALAAELGLDGAQVLGFIGSFYGYEGLDIMLHAMPALRAKHPAIKLLLVGGGPEAERLEALAATLDIADMVVFTGRVDHERVQDYYDLVDLFIYPRVSIPLTEKVTPLKPLEAMAQGKIVLASDVGGHRELIADGETGYLFRAGDPASLADEATRALEHRESWPATRDRARAFVERERTWPASVARYRAVYERLIGAARLKA